MGHPGPLHNTSLHWAPDANALQHLSGAAFRVTSQIIPIDFPSSSPERGPAWQIVCNSEWHVQTDVALSPL